MRPNGLAGEAKEDATFCVFRRARNHPSVVGGVVYLENNGSPNIQNCVPSGWYRKGDGDVQHWFIRNELTFDFSREIGLAHTDHPGWLVATIT